MCRLMALAEPQAEDMQHIRDIVALTSPGQAWTVPVELGRAQKQPPKLQQVLMPGTRVLLSLYQPLGMLCRAWNMSCPRRTRSARAAACTVEVGAPLPKWGETKSCTTGGLFTSTAPPAAGHVTLPKVVSFYTDLGPCHSPKSKSP